MNRSFPVDLEAASRAPIRVVLFGLGAIGLEVARLALTKRSLRVVAAVDADPGKLGKDLADLLGLPGPLGVPVTADSRAAVAARAQVVIHSTQSFFPDILDQLQSLASLGLNVISSAEELFYPYLKYASDAEALDRHASAHGVRVLGTGVNPGFVMDTLPLVASAVSPEATHLRIERIVNASLRRYNLQKKIGAGMTVPEFEAEMAAGRMGHVGLVESVAMLARGLAWVLDRIDETIEPVVAASPIESDHFRLSRGMVAGLRQEAVGRLEGQERIRLHLEMALGAPDAHDQVTLTGHPDLVLRLPEGVRGDQATAAMLVNAVPRLLETAPGLRTMLDLPLVRLID